MAHVLTADDLAPLGRDGWLQALDDIAEDRGYFEPLGPEHSAAFTDAGPVLLVTFETLDEVRARPAQLPLGFELADARGWSQLTLLAHGDSWYRDRRVFGYFDRLVDDGFFEDFDRVILMGSGMGAYGAAAFSVAAPGATVLAIRPVATLDPLRAGWDRRFMDRRRLDFSGRYAFAPQMSEAAERAFLIFDPEERTDAMHAALFTSDNAVPVRMRHFGTDLLADLQRMGALDAILDAAGRPEGLRPLDVWQALRARGRHVPYLRRLLTELAATDRPMRLGKVTRLLSERFGGKRFGRMHAEVARRLAAAGLTLPQRREAPREAAE